MINDFATNGGAAIYAKYALIAEDMYRAGLDPLSPPPDPRIDLTTWTVKGHISAREPTLQQQADGTKHIGYKDDVTVFFGYVLQRIAAPNDLLVAVRGTSGAIEWAIDAEFLYKKHPDYDCNVEQGFWSLYETFQICDPVSGAVLFPTAAAGISKWGGGKDVVFTGHSLGSALATYLSERVASAKQVNSVTACLFASPRTGDPNWAQQYAKSVPTYRVINYLIDIVPHVPLAPDYAHLPAAEWLDPAQAQSNVKCDPTCNHHLLCYADMLKAGSALAMKLSPVDDVNAACIKYDAPPPNQFAEIVGLGVKALGDIGDAEFAKLKEFATDFGVKVPNDAEIGLDDLGK
jgi:triacylglycerol lipase